MKLIPKLGEQEYEREKEWANQGSQNSEEKME